MPGKKTTLTFAALPAVLLIAGCAQTAAEPEAPIAFDTSRQCFFTDRINGFGDAPDSPEGRERLTVRTGVREEWLLEAIGSCPELDFAQQIALDTNGRTTMCTGAVETLLVPSGAMRSVDRCSVRLLGKVIQPEG